MSRQLKAILMFGLVAIALGLSDSQAQIQLRFDPADTTVGPGELLQLSITLDDFQEVRSFEVFFRFDPEVLAFESGEAGSVFSDTGCLLFSGAEADTSDLVHAYVVILGSDCWATGPGQLFSLQFSTVGLGASTVEVEDVALFAPQTGELENVFLDPATIIVVDGQSAVPSAWVRGAKLNPCYPNPFNPSTTISFELSKQTTVSLRVFDLSGRIIKELLGDDVLDEGMHQTVWNGTDESGRRVASGTYLYRLETGEGGNTRRMVLLK